MGEAVADPGPPPSLDSSVYGRQPPNSPESERGVLCSMLIDSESIKSAIEEGLRVEDFYHPANAVVFGAMLSLHEHHQPINTVTLMEELIHLQKLDQIGGAGFIASLEAMLPTSAHMGAYLKIIKDKSMLRKLIVAATRVVESSFKQERNVELALDEAERVILQIRDESAQKGMLSIQHLVSLALKRLETLSMNKTSLVGLSSGFRDLDHLTSGLQEGELIVIAARPSMGKTAFTLNIASHVAMKTKSAVAFFSLEMGAEQLVHRLIGAEARMDLSELRRGTVPKNEYSDLIAAAGDLGQSPLYIDETPSLSIAEMRNKCRRMVKRHDVKLVIVDYLQLMTGPEGYDNKATEVAEISKGLKSIARELKIPVIALSQLNRGVESRTDKRPMMSDLRESGAIEQDADVIAFLYREEYYLRDKTPDDKKGIAEVIIAKNRNGPTGQFELRFFNHITRFTDLD